MRVKQIILQMGIISSIFMMLISAVTAYAQSGSTNYRVNEVQFGSGGRVDGTSTSYKAQTSIGSLGGGNASSTSYKAYPGFLTPNEPYIEVGVISGQVDLGTLSTSTTGRGAGSFYVRAYTSGGYTVISMSTPPKNASGVILKSKTTLAAPILGTEEFGMNLVLNSNFCGAGCDLGANPSPVPNSTFANGAAAAGYSTSGQFKYVQGDTIASATSGNGQTNFTASFIADITRVTAAGEYSMAADFVAVASY